MTQYNSESLNRHITQTYRFGLFSQGFVDILAAEQTPDSSHWYQGTADAVRQSLRHILTYNPSHILILSGDHLYRMDYGQLYRHHIEANAEVTLCVMPVSARKASSLGILKMEETGRITRFREKPQEADEVESLKVDVERWSHVGVTEENSLMASMGIYLFNTEVLVKVLDEEPKMDFGRHIIPYSLPRYDVFGYIFNDYWEDIGTIKAFYRANLDLTVEEPKFNFYDPHAPIYSHPRFLPPNRVLRSKIDSSIIAEGCEVVEARIEESVVGIRSIVREGCDLEKTLMLGADYYDDERITGRIPLGFGRNCLVKRAIIDKNARIGNDVKIVNEKNLQEHDGDNFFVRDGIVVIPKNAEVKDGTVI